MFLHSTAGIPQTDIELTQHHGPSGEHQLYEKAGGPPLQYQQQHQQQPKQVMVACSAPGAGASSSSNYRSSAVAEGHEVQFPDVIQQQPPGAAAATKSPKKTAQPLNPAALVQVPPSPPLQFPHQFPHLIHSSRQHQAAKPAPPPPPARYTQIYLSSV